MDIHPILVHFPIALLTIYSLFELVRFRRVVESPYWFHIKAILVVTGELFGMAAYMMGPEAEDKLVELHSIFAAFTLWVFGFIAIAYLIEWLKSNKVSLFIMKPYIIISLAILGLALVTVTGGLGGAIVYGTHFDPLMAPIFKILGLY